MEIWPKANNTNNPASMHEPGLTPKQATVQGIIKLLSCEGQSKKGRTAEQQQQRGKDIVKELVQYKYDRKGISGISQEEGLGRLKKACLTTEFAQGLLALATDDSFFFKPDFPQELLTLLKLPVCDNAITELVNDTETPQLQEFLEKNALWPRLSFCAKGQMSAHLSAVAGYIDQIDGDSTIQNTLKETFQDNLASLSKQYKIIVRVTDTEAVMAKITENMSGNTSDHVLINPPPYKNENYIFWNASFQFGFSHGNTAKPNHPFTFDHSQLEPIEHYVVRRAIQAAVIHGQILKEKNIPSIVGLAEFADENSRIPEIKIPGYSLINLAASTNVRRGLCILLPEGPTAQHAALSTAHAGDVFCVDRGKNFPIIHVLHRQFQTIINNWSPSDKKDSIVMGDFNASVTSNNNLSSKLPATNVKKSVKTSMPEVSYAAIDYILHIEPKKILSVNRPLNQTFVAISTTGSILQHTQGIFFKTNNGRL